LSSITERYEQAVEHALKAVRLSPFDPLNYHPHLALALTYLFTQRFEEAVKHANLAIQANPRFGLLHVVLVASLANLDSLETARAAAGHLLEITPEFKIGNFMQENFARPPLMEGLARALKRSGLPS
jgi:Flp pilus assembly protein TadD